MAGRADLAQWWAPVNFQDVDTTGTTSLGGKSDYLTSDDYDGDLNGRNNWENTGRYPLAAQLYYSAVQTAGFTYLTYVFFHARDWSDGSLSDHEADLSEHENDTEGVLAVVKTDIFAPGGMWDSRNTTSLCASRTVFAGDNSANPYGAKCGQGGAFTTCDTNSANPPWGWDDQNDKPLAGALATDPSGLVWDYFSWSGKPSASEAYTRNPYRS